MKVELAFRVFGALAFAILGWRFGSTLPFPSGLIETLPVGPVAAGFGFLIGTLLAPYLTTRPANFLVDHARRLPIVDLLAAVLGLLLALILSALLAVPLSLLPDPLGRVLPFAGCIFMCYLGVTIAVSRRDDLFALLGWFRPHDPEPVRGALAEPGVLLDTSAIIDGRILDISRAGFLPGPVLVTRFVLHELQHIADSADPLRRGRGRRGLELLDRLKKVAGVPVQVYDGDAEGDGVDAKLVSLARQLRCAIVTNDYNLNRVAVVQGIRILNVNELANAVKLAFLPGEEIQVRVIQEGKEPGQGVGYLDDGTMVVIDGGRRYIDSDVGVIVTRVFQTTAGRMIFAQARENHKETSTPS